MMVEPPTEFIEEQSDRNQEEATVRLLPQTFQPKLPSQQRSHSEPAGDIQDRRYQTRTPELQKRRSTKTDVQRSPSSPGHIAPFDWDDFELRYQKALGEADEQEKELLVEFDQLVKVWREQAKDYFKSS